MTVSICSTELG